nr:MAG TPA: hypothetical protein [Caudoviricetes sp.]
MANRTADAHPWDATGQESLATGAANRTADA